MTPEQEQLRRIIDELQDCEVEIKAQQLVLDELLTTHPTFPIQEKMESARTKYRLEVAEKYRPLLEAMEGIDVDGMIANIPPPRWKN